MTLNLSSVEAKFRRAAEHIQTLQDEVLAWAKTGPTSTVKKRKADFTRHSLYLNVKSEPPLERWTLIVGDALNNLRCALDHLVYAIAVHESGQSPPPRQKKLAFVIGETADEFIGMSDRIGSLSPPVRTAIETVQPYNRPNKSFPLVPPLLLVLRNLGNTDKHRLVRLAFATVQQIAAGLTWEEPAGGPHVQSVEIAAYQGECKDGTEILRLTFDVPCPNVKYDRIDGYIIIALWHGKVDPNAKNWTGRTEVVPLMDFIKDEVRHIIDTVVAAVK